MTNIKLHNLQQNIRFNEYHDLGKDINGKHMKLYSPYTAYQSQIKRVYDEFTKNSNWQPVSDYDINNLTEEQNKQIVEIIKNETTLNSDSTFIVIVLMLKPNVQRVFVFANYTLSGITNMDPNRYGIQNSFFTGFTSGNTINLNHNNLWNSEYLITNNKYLMDEKWGSFGGEHIYWWQDIKKLLGGNVKFEFIQPNSGSKYIKEEAPKYSIAGEWGSGNPGGYDGADGQVPLDTHRGSQQIFFLYNYEEPKVSPSKKGDLYYFKNLRQVDTGDSIPWGKKHMIRNSFPDISDYEFIMMCKEELLKNKDELKGMEIYYTPSPLKLLHKAVFYSDISNIVTHKTHLSLHGSFGIGFTYFNNIYPTIDLYTLDYFLDDVYNNQKLSDEDKKAILASKEQFDNTPRQTYSRQKGIKYDGKSTSKNQLKEIISSVESLLKALKSD